MVSNQSLHEFLRINLQWNWYWHGESLKLSTVFKIEHKVTLLILKRRTKQDVHHSSSDKFYQKYTFYIKLSFLLVEQQSKIDSYLICNCNKWQIKSFFQLEMECIFYLNVLPYIDGYSKEGLVTSYL